MSFGPAVRNGLGIGLGPTATLATAFSQATLDFDFIDNLVFPTDITFTRASSATYFNSAGVLTTAGNNVPRLDYNPATLAPRGLLIEEQRTNSIRNNTMQGAVAGTPGTLPTNWQQNSGTVAVNVVGTGTENGITYIDLQFVGTPNQTFANIRFEPNAQIVATNGQTWTSSFFVRRVAGATTNITEIDNRIYFRDAGGGGIQESGASILSLLSNSSINNSRTINSLTAANASIVRINNGINFGLTISAAIDITLRIGLPQLELGAFATSVIPTTTAAATRSADVASVNTLSPWYNQTNGTVYAEFTPAFQGSATAAGNNPGVWGATQNGLGAFNGYGVRLSAQSSTADNINGVSRYMPSGFITQVNIGPNAFLNLGQTYKTAFAWETSGIAGSRDGQAVVTNTNPAAAAMGTHDQFYLGRQNIGGTPTQLNGYLRRITYYPSRLSNAQLQALTA